MPAEILDFRPGDKLSVSINRQLKMILTWNGKEYEFHQQGLEFLSPGPQPIAKWDGKR